MAARPALPTSSVPNPIDIAHTEKATHVYVKIEDPSGLQPRWEGPYPIESRPSRSTIIIRIGSFVDGKPRLQQYNWNTCKIAHLREDATEAQRPRLGRKPASSANDPKPTEQSEVNRTRAKVNKRNQPVDQPIASPESAIHETSNRKQPHPDYLAKGPLITNEMFDKWTPDLLNIPTRPVRATRNPNPRYVD